MKLFGLCFILYTILVARSNAIDLKQYYDKCSQSTNDALNAKEISITGSSKAFAPQYDQDLAWVLKRNSTYGYIYTPEYPSNGTVSPMEVIEDNNITLTFHDMYFIKDSQQTKTAKQQDVNSIELHMVHADSTSFAIFVFKFAESNASNVVLPELINPLVALSKDDKNTLIKIQNFKLENMFGQQDWSKNTHYEQTATIQNGKCKNVQWYVFESKLAITKDQLEKLVPALQTVTQKNPRHTDNKVTKTGDGKMGTGNGVNRININYALVVVLFSLLAVFMH